MPQGEDEALVLIRNRTAEGGVNTRVFPLDIRDDQSVVLQNIDTSTPGQRKVRGGTEVAAGGVTAGPILAMQQFAGSALSKELLIITPGANDADNLRLWSWDGSAADFTLAGTLTGMDNLNDSDVDIIVGYDYDENNVALMNYNRQVGTFGRHIWNGSVLTTCQIGDVLGPNVSVFTFAFGRMLAGVRRDTAGRVNLHWSDVISFTHTGWSSITTTQRMIFGGGSSQGIVFAKEFREREIIIFMEDRIEEVVVETNNFLNVAFDGGLPLDPITGWERKVISTDIGCASRRSVATVGEDLYFADQRGNIRSIARTITDANRGVRSDPISDPIDNWIQRINPSALDKIVCTGFDRWLIVALPIDSGTAATHIFALDVPRSVEKGFPVWDGPWTGLNPQTLATAEFDTASDSTDLKPTLYIGSSETATGTVSKLFRGSSDDGTAVIMQEESKRYSFGGLELQKKLERLDVFGLSSENVTLHIEANPDALGWKEVGFINVSGEAPLLPEPLPFILGGSGVARKKFSLDSLGLLSDVQFRFTATAVQSLTMLGYTVYGFPQNYDWDTEGN